jgi:molybdopterin molybdotransferase
MSLEAPMNTYQEVLKLTLNLSCPLLPKRMPLAEVLGLVLADNVIAVDSVPPFTNSAMDGFAVRIADCTSASIDNPIMLKVVGEIQAGQSEIDTLQIGASYRIMTGGVMPLGADTVIPVEEIEVVGSYIKILKCPSKGDHVRLAGEDIATGEVVISRDRALRPAEIGVLAAIGCTEVLVHPRPVVSVITTGNELVDVSERPSLGQIRDVNIYSMCAQAKSVGAAVMPHPRVPDELAAVIDTLTRAVTESDVILINGGISVGDFDYTKLALKHLGAKQVFWRVAQKPGGPMGLWLLGGKLVFGIPGNPVAAMITFEEYVRPALRKMMGYQHIHRPERIGVIDVEWNKRSADGRMNFLRVVAKLHEQCIHVMPTGPQGSGLISSMMLANALALIPAETLVIPVGGTVLLHLIDEQEDH